MSNPIATSPDIISTVATIATYIGVAVTSVIVGVVGALKKVNKPQKNDTKEFLPVKKYPDHSPETCDLKGEIIELKSHFETINKDVNELRLFAVGTRSDINYIKENLSTLGTGVDAIRQFIYSLRK